MTDIDRIADRRRRIAAAGIVAVVSVAMAAVAHAVAGGGAPSIVAITLALLVGGTVGMCVVGPRLTRARAAVGVVLDQAVFQTLFAFFGTSSTSVGTMPPGAVVDSAHAAHSMATLDLAQTTTAAPTLSMLITHLGAALVAYGMLRHGLAAIDAIATALVMALARALDPARRVALPVSSPLTIAIVDDRRALSTEPRLLPDRRGPPALAAR